MKTKKPTAEQNNYNESIELVVQALDKAEQDGDNKQFIEHLINDIELLKGEKNKNVDKSEIRQF